MFDLAFTASPFPGARIVDFLDTEMHRSMQEAVDILADGAEGFAPVDTGELRNSIEPKTVRGTFSRGTLSGQVVAGAEHAPFVEFGVEPHIRQHQGGALFTHPGQDAQPFMQETVDLSYDAIADMFALAVDIGFQRAA